MFGSMILQKKLFVRKLNRRSYWLRIEGRVIGFEKLNFIISPISEEQIKIPVEVIMG